MNRFAGMLAIAGSVLMGATCQSTAAQLNTMDEVGAALQACWQSPPGYRNAMVTLSFSFDTNGTLIGPPMPTDISVPGDSDARQTFVNAAIKALEDCMPLSFSPDLAAGLGGNPFTMQFRSSD